MELVQSIGDIFPQVLVEIGDHIQECIKGYGDGVMERVWLKYY